MKIRNVTLATLKGTIQWQFSMFSLLCDHHLWFQNILTAPEESDHQPAFRLSGVLLSL